MDRRASFPTSHPGTFVRPGATVQCTETLTEIRCHTRFQLLSATAASFWLLSENEGNHLRLYSAAVSVVSLIHCTIREYVNQDGGRIRCALRTVPDADARAGKRCSDVKMGCHAD